VILLRSKIATYIKYITDHPLENVSKAAEQLLPDLLIKKRESVVVPELMNLPPSKRSLAKRIIKDKTGYDVETAYDSKNNIIKMKDQNTKTLGFIPKDFKIMQWLYK
jgi:hypothetical protein